MLDTNASSDSNLMGTDTGSPTVPGISSGMLSEGLSGGGVFVGVCVCVGRFVGVGVYVGVNVGVGVAVGVNVGVEVVVEVGVPVGVLV